MKRVILFCFFLFITAGISFAATDRIIRYGERVEQYYHAGDYDAVIQVCQKILNISAQNNFARDYINKAETNKTIQADIERLVESDNVLLAEEKINYLLRESPGSRKLQKLEKQVAYAKSRLQKKLSQEMYGFSVERIRACIMEKKFAQAQSLLDGLKKRHPENAEMRTLSKTLAQRVEQDKQEKFIAQRSSDIASITERIDAALRNNEFSSARGALTQLTQAYPSDSLVNARAVSLEQKIKLSEASFLKEKERNEKAELLKEQKFTQEMADIETMMQKENYTDAEQRLLMLKKNYPQKGAEVDNQFTQLEQIQKLSREVNSLLLSELFDQALERTRVSREFYGGNAHILELLNNWDRKIITSKVRALESLEKRKVEEGKKQFFTDIGTLRILIDEKKFAQAQSLLDGLKKRHPENAEMRTLSKTLAQRVEQDKQEKFIAQRSSDIASITERIDAAIEKSDFTRAFEATEELRKSYPGDSLVSKTAISLDKKISSQRTRYLSEVQKKERSEQEKTLAAQKEDLRNSTAGMEDAIRKADFDEAKKILSGLKERHPSAKEIQETAVSFGNKIKTAEEAFLRKNQQKEKQLFTATKESDALTISQTVLNHIEAADFSAARAALHSYKAKYLKEQDAQKKVLLLEEKIKTAEHLHQNQQEEIRKKFTQEMADIETMMQKENYTDAEQRLLMLKKNYPQKGAEVEKVLQRVESALEKVKIEQEKKSAAEKRRQQERDLIFAQRLEGITTLITQQKFAEAKNSLLSLQKEFPEYQQIKEFLKDIDSRIQQHNVEQKKIAARKENTEDNVMQELAVRFNAAYSKKQYVEAQNILTHYKSTFPAYKKIHSFTEEKFALLRKVRAEENLKQNLKTQKSFGHATLAKDELVAQVEVLIHDEYLARNDFEGARMVLGEFDSNFSIDPYLEQKIKSIGRTINQAEERHKSLAGISTTGYGDEVLDGKIAKLEMFIQLGDFINARNLSDELLRTYPENIQVRTLAETLNRKLKKTRKQDPARTPIPENAVSKEKKNPPAYLEKRS